MAASSKTAQADRAPTHSKVRVPWIRYAVLAALVTALMTAIPWPAIWMAQHGLPLEDRRVYESQVINGHLAFDYKQFDDALSYIVNEYLWGWILNLLVRAMGLPLEVAFGLISAFVVFIACLLVLRHAPPIYLILLFNPSFIDLAFSQMRIATAIALMSVAYLLRGPRALVLPLRVAFLLASCFVHTSMAIFVMMFLLALFISRRPEIHRPVRRYVMLAVTGLGAALLLGPLREGILTDIGDRRDGAEYISWGPRFYIFWVLMAIVLTLLWKRSTVSAVTSYALAALLAVVFGLGLGVYVNRVIAVSLPFLIATLYAIPRSWRQFLIVAYVGYTGLYWLYWLAIL